MILLKIFKKKELKKDPFVLSPLYNELEEKNKLINKYIQIIEKSDKFKKCDICDDYVDSSMTAYCCNDCGYKILCSVHITKKVKCYLGQSGFHNLCNEHYEKRKQTDELIFIKFE